MSNVKASSLPLLIVQGESEIGNIRVDRKSFTHSPASPYAQIGKGSSKSKIVLGFQTCIGSIERNAGICMEDMSPIRMPASNFGLEKIEYPYET